MIKAYARFLIQCAQNVMTGNRYYLAWNAILLVLIILGTISYAIQLDHGFIVTNLSDQVSWGVYIANFTFLVGLADAVVLLIIPAYIYKNENAKEAVLIGALMSIAVVIMCLLFIIVDLGRPDRFLHIIPGFGKLNFPNSILAWDVIVLNGYLLLSLHIPGYLLYKKYLGQEPTSLYYLPFIFISIVWAISMHTVTAFLFSGLGGRPFWNSAVLAPRFLVSSFACGPAFLIIVFRVIAKFTKLKMKQSLYDMLQRIMIYTLMINFFLLFSEVFKEFYTDSVHVASARYLFFGLHGHGMLIPYIWSAIAMEIIALTILLIPRLRSKYYLLIAACVMTVLGVWIEKGMGLIVPGFVPSPLGDLVEYTPSLIEFFVSLGIWALGAMIFTVLAKIGVAIETGELRCQSNDLLT